MVIFSNVSNSFHNNNNDYSLWRHCTKCFSYILSIDLHLQLDDGGPILCIFIDGEAESHNG